MSPRASLKDPSAVGAVHFISNLLHYFFFFKFKRNRVRITELAPSVINGEC